MNLAFITPIAILDQICSKTKTQMCLAHQVLKSTKYGLYYRDRRVNGDRVIMDNSLWELGHALDHAPLLNAVKLVRPTDLIIPDVFRDAAGTLESFERFLALDLNDNLWERNCAVVHGRDREEWLASFDTLNADPRVHVLALPKVLDDIWQPGGRLGCVTFLDRTNRVRADKLYHCLGIWDDPIEILLLAHFKWITSLDSALPIHSGMQDMRFHEELGLSRRRPRRPHIYFEAPIEELQPHLETINHNIDISLSWANGVHNNGK